MIIFSSNDDYVNNVFELNFFLLEFTKSMKYYIIISVNSVARFSKNASKKY